MERLVGLSVLMHKRAAVTRPTNSDYYEFDTFPKIAENLYGLIFRDRYYESGEPM
jgi:hypothetical protein